MQLRASWWMSLLREVGRICRRRTPLPRIACPGRTQRLFFAADSSTEVDPAGSHQRWAAVRHCRQNSNEPTQAAAPLSPLAGRQSLRDVTATASAMHAVSCIGDDVDVVTADDIDVMFILALGYDVLVLALVTRSVVTTSEQWRLAT